VTTLTFFPITMGTYANADEAMQASRNRQEHLIHLYAEKGCADEAHRQQATPQTIVIPIMQPMAYAPAYAPQPMAYAQPTHHTVQVVEPLSARTVEDVPASRYSAEHVRNASYLFED
jgi:hypothetical protein